MNSIITKRGDDGMTDCLYGRRISKGSELIEAIGNLDELNAWIGFAAKVDVGTISSVTIGGFQKNLICLMGEISAGHLNFKKYKKQFGAIGKKEIKQIENLVASLENHAKFTDWATPNNRWDIACRVCRRAERSLYKIEQQEKVRKEVFVFINRLSDLLWILARKI